MATISKENYLKSIYSLAKEEERVSTSQLSATMNVSNAAISEMANKLSRQGYVKYEKYKGVKILPKGRKIAIDIIRKHRLWELFLIDTLGLDWTEVHDEAESLEHSTSEFLINKIDEYLNFPKSDPHGEPIPNINGEYREKIDDIPMKDCEEGQYYFVSRVRDHNNKIIEYLSKISLTINKKIKVNEILSFDGSIIVEIDGVKHSLSNTLIKYIYLKKVN